MSLSLRLFITADWPGRDAACEWTLVNAQGTPLQRGRSEPRHWPAAEHCELILSADQCLSLKAQLPKGARSRPAEVIAYALEDQLIGEADGEHFVVGDSDSAGEGQPTPIWVIARSRFRALLAALRTLERMPQRVVSEIQIAPLPANGWSVCLHPDNTSGLMRLGAEEGYAFDLGDARQPPLELQLALQAARNSDSAPQSIAVYSSRSKTAGLEFDAAAAAAWQAALGLPVHAAGDYAWRDLPTADARNLLSGEFAPPRQPNSGWDSLKPALAIGLLTLTIYALFSLGEWFWLDRQSEQLRQRMTDIFRSAYPQAQAIVNPPLQMQRLNDQLRRERGQLGSTDFLPLLAVASEALGGQGKLRSIAYEDGRLELGVLLANAADAERLRGVLAGRGLAVTLRDTHPGNGGVVAVFALRGSL
ncbi:MAG: hypothetical protein HY066_03895 [Betaproteobacteria bacterium]|nr:hypothetical protein [Betaproteobacteria bacterium]